MRYAESFQSTSWPSERFVWKKEAYVQESHP